MWQFEGSDCSHQLPPESNSMSKDRIRDPSEEKFRMQWAGVAYP